ncbi:ATP-binding protein [Dyadobacter sp. CY261]|uniref:ATP-binding protein n=1 Tax=Dyadobacter sp. CY261 TaxID=2907203 RepID=UPI001F225F5F|nr:ATP-binding protein [Dyadobacter sp. CY261]MCF0069560.1 ATP-binding protein [Dyadobacter sp. CY261]
MIVRFLSFLQFVTIICAAQESPWQPVTISDGLSQGMVYDLLEDKEGFLWFATKDGLNRYDGYNFKVFTHDPYDDRSISGNTCTALLQDSKGRIWIGTEKDGLNLFDPKSQRFYHAAVSDKDHSNAGNYGIIFIKEDVNGTIWLVADKPGKIYKISSLELYPIQSDFSEHISPVSSNQKSHKDYRFNFDHHAMGFSFSINLYLSGDRHPKVSDIPYSFTSTILEDADKRFWCIGQDSIICWKNGPIKTIIFPKGGMSVANQFSDGTIAICNQQFTWLFKPDELLKLDSLTARNAYMAMPQTMNTVNQIFKDRRGNLWASTKGYGLLKFNPRVKQFQTFLPSKSPAALFQDFKGNVYIHANYNPSYQIYKLNKSDNSIQSLPSGIGDQDIYHHAIYQDRQHHIWMIIHNNTKPETALVKLTQEWKIVKKYPLPLVDEKNFTWKIHEDEKGFLWLGLSNGAYSRFDPIAEKFTAYSYRSLLPLSGSVVENFCMYQDSKTMWIGTQKGLIRAENFQANPSFSIYKNSPNDRQSLSNDFVSGAINDPAQPDKYLWVSTKGGGLERLDKQTGKFEHFTESQGLPNKVIYGILLGNDNNLWMSTNRGLSSLNPKSLIFTNFNKSDGLQDDEFNTNSYFKAANGELLFGGIDGINIFRPSAVTSNRTPAVTRLIGLQINNQEIEAGDKTNLLPQALGYINELHLSHDQNQLALEFALMDFTNPVKNRFRYRLEGIDGDWVEAGTHHFANYAQLPYGNYTFKVTGTTNGEVWSKPVELRIRIHPPFYKTWWAYLMYCILLVYLSYRWNRSQLKRVRLQAQLLYKDKEAARLAELDTIKNNFFTNISHEFRTPLTLLTGPLNLFQKKYPTEELIPTMQRNLFRLQTLINQLLDLSKLEAGKMQPKIQYDDLSGFLNHLFASFESLAQSKQIIFEKSQSHTTQMAYFDSDKMEKIVTNLLSNAFKFTPGNGRIRVDVSYLSQPSDAAPKSVSIAITDDGIGIDPARLPKIFDRFYQVDDGRKRDYEGTGIGLALVKELVNALHGTIDVKSTPGSGSTFTVTLPCDLATWADYVAVEERENTSHTFAQEAGDALTEQPATENTGDLPVLLIVEDNADLRKFVRSIFEDTYYIEEAQDGQQGLELAINQVPDVIISDLMMPRMDGLEFCKAVKTDLRTDHIPVILLTAKAALEDRLEGLEFGADDYIAKPFETDELKVRVRNLLKQRQLLRQKYSLGTTSNDVQSETRKAILAQDQFLQKANAVLDEYLSESSFTVEQFAAEMDITAVQLRRKLKALTGQTGIEYQRNYRLEKAALLLKNKAGSVSEIAYLVGFESLSYFSKVFQEKFGKKPSEWT